MKKHLLTMGFLSATLLTLVGCGGGTPTTYTLNFSTIQGTKLADFSVKLMKGDKQVAGGFTDNSGSVIFTAPAGDYDVKIVGLESNIKFKDLKVSKEKTEYDFVATTRLGDPYAAKGTHYQIGDIVYDFDCTIVGYESDGKTLKVETIMASDYLEDHEVLVLNNWETWCGPCESEFPMMNEAWDKMKDKVALFAFSTDDSHEAVAKYKKSHGITFDMGCDQEVLDCVGEKRNDYGTSITQFFGTKAVPTTVIIDRYGTMINKYVGSVTSVDEFVVEWSNYTGDDYKPSDWVEMNKKYFDKHYSSYEV